MDSVVETEADELVRDPFCLSLVNGQSCRRFLKANAWHYIDGEITHYEALSCRVQAHLAFFVLMWNLRAFLSNAALSLASSAVCG